MSDKATIVEKHLTIEDHNQGNAVDSLATSTGLSKQQIKMAMKKGAVWLSTGNRVQRLRRSKKTLIKGNVVHLYFNENILSEKPQEPTKIADEGGYSIWFKPYGVYCQGSKWGDHCTINRMIENHDDRPAFIVHRLDRAATGLIIVAHSKSIAGVFSQYFQKRQLTKKYRAIVQGHFPKSGESVSLNSDIDSRSALSHVVLIRFDEQSCESEVEVTIETGRKHQIRRHLSEQGHPIVGDRLYGDETHFTKNLQLCAYYLSFKCPVDDSLKSYQLPRELLFKPEYSVAKFPQDT